MLRPAIGRRRRMLPALAATIGATALTGLSAPAAIATPPGIPSAATAQTELDGLRVAGETSSSGYDRDEFPHWHAVEANCNTREMVLRRDGTGVSVGNDCYPTSGRWTSPYDGDAWTRPSDVDIDHVVPLAEAWRSGASRWTTARREAFANDLDSPQLIAVTDDVNQAKGDKDPSDWKPPRSGYHCTYARMWIRSKHRWGLTLQSGEQRALQSMLDRC